MMEPNNINAAADEILASAMLGQGWEKSLQLLADATGAGGASLVRIHAGRHVTHLSSADWSAFETASMAADVPSSQLRYYPEHSYGSGFCADHDVWADETMRRDPYFQEFLRPRGVFFHAKLRLWSEPDDRVTLTLKRRTALGSYEPSDIAVLDSVVPRLHAAFQVGRRVLDAEASGMVRVLLERGDPVFELDARGRVLRSHAIDDTGERIVVVQGKRLIAVDRRAQATVERAIAAAIGEPGQPAFLGIKNQEGAHRFLRVVPVAGRARDIFLATAAILVVERDRVRGGLDPDVIRQALALTEREAQVAALLARGSSPQTIAECLEIGRGTVRGHMKSIFSKTGARRQGELIALLCVLQR